MKILDNISLKKFNTFGIDVKASRFIEITSLENLQSVLNKKEPYFILGGGSNMLLTKDIKKTVLHINLKDIKRIKETDATIFVEVQAGETWHEFVLWALEHDYGGIENLSLIPGNVGSCPIQNIGAYGVEVKDTIHKVTCIEIETSKIISFLNKDCNFGYRNSIFKNEVKGKYIITSVIFELTKTKHKLAFNYGAIQDALTAESIDIPTIQNISNAIIGIRQTKLPDPNKIGNSGSFFKNPVVPKKVFKQIQETNTNMPFYAVDEDSYKIPAGWLIEQSGYKGKRFGDAGVHKNQALVLVNYGNATGSEILALAKKVQEKVKELFSIELEMEVTIF